MDTQDKNQTPSESTSSVFVDTTLRPPNTFGFKAWNTKDFVRPVEDNPTNSLNNIFGASSSDPRVLFMLQLVISMASLPHLGLCAALNMKDNLETLLKAYGAVVYYTELCGAIHHKQEEFEPAFRSGLFEQMTLKDVISLVNNGKHICHLAFENAIEEEPSIKKNKFHFFSLSTTFQNYIAYNAELMQRVMPVVHACRYVMKELKITIPHILVDKSFKSKNFVLNMFHAPRMAVPYISFDPSVTAKACMAIQLYKQNSDQSSYDKCLMTDILDHYHLMTGLFNGDKNAFQKFKTFIDIDELTLEEVIDILVIYNKLITNLSIDIGSFNCLNCAIDEYKSNVDCMTYMPYKVVMRLPKEVITKDMVETVLQGKSFVAPQELTSIHDAFKYNHIVLATYLRDKGIEFNSYSSTNELIDIYYNKCDLVDYTEKYKMPDNLMGTKNDKNISSESGNRRRPHYPPQQSYNKSRSVIKIS